MDEYSGTCFEKNDQKKPGFAIIEGEVEISGHIAKGLAAKPVPQEWVLST